MTFFTPNARRFRLSVAILCVLTLLAAVRGDWTVDTPGFLLLWTLMVASYLAVLRAGDVLSRDEIVISRADLKWALALLFSVRLVLSFGEPLLSDDVYRSVWEGRIQRAGGNPFAWSDRPEAEKWTQLRDGHVFPRINHRDYAAIYPPAWQWAMRGVNAVSDSVTAVKLFLVGCEAVFWIGLVALLRARRLPDARVLIAAASPLALVEIAGSGHNEAMGMAALVWALAALERNRRGFAALALALATLSKLIPMILASPWLRKFRVRDFVLTAASVLLVSAPFVDETALLSLDKYGQLWRFNETSFALTAWLGGSHQAGVRLSAMALLTLGLILILRRADPIHAGLAMGTALLLVMPNVLPWYALWLLVFLPAIPPSPLALGAFAFTLTVPLAYLVYPEFLAGGPWYLPWPIRVAEYGLPLLVFAVARGTGCDRLVSSYSKFGSGTDRHHRWL